MEWIKGSVEIEGMGKVFRERFGVSIDGCNCVCHRVITMSKAIRTYWYSAQGDYPFVHGSMPVGSLVVCTGFLPALWANAETRLGLHSRTVMGKKI